MSDTPIYDVMMWKHFRRHSVPLFRRLLGICWALVKVQAGALIFCAGFAVTFLVVWACTR